MKRHALFVGVDKYSDSTIQNLNYPSEDATELASVFRRLLKFNRVEKLINPKHSPEVVDAVKDMTRGLGPGDLFLFFFAGHGFRVKENHVLVCARDEFSDLEDEYAGLPVGQLKKRMRGPWNRMLILDACQNDIRATRGADTGVTERDLALIHEAEGSSSESGYQIVLTACSEGQKALEVSDLGHGLFTSAFLDSVTSFADARRRLDLEALRADLGKRMDGLIVQYRLSGRQEPFFTMPTDASGIVLLDGAISVSVPFYTPPPSIVSSLVVCPICGKKNEQKDTFKCRECGRDNLCLRHQDEATFLCNECVAAQRKAREEAERKALKVSATNYDTQPGGDNLDQAIMHLMIENFKAQEGIDLSKDPLALRRLKEAVEAAKSALASATTYDIYLPFITADTTGPKHFRVTLTKEKLETLEMESVNRIAEVGRKAHESTRNAESLSMLPHLAGECRTLTLPGGAEMEMIYCPPGEFMMGSPTSEEGRNDDETQHRVRLTKGFWLGKYPVTQKQWQSVMGSNPSKFKGDDCPVEEVSWDDCQVFIKNVNAALGCGARLPTEAEWEYACRAGTTTAYFWGNALNGDRANCDGNYPCGTKTKGPYLARTTPVGTYEANPWGLCDIHGNVCEWCADRYGDYPTGSVVDPQGPASGVDRVLRGGCWVSNARNCRSAHRGGDYPGDRSYFYGFRLSCSVGPRGQGAEP